SSAESVSSPPPGSPPAQPTPRTARNSTAQYDPRRNDTSFAILASSGGRDHAVAHPTRNQYGPCSEQFHPPPPRPSSIVHRFERQQRHRFRGGSRPLDLGNRARCQVRVLGVPEDGRIWRATR